MCNRAVLHERRDWRPSDRGGARCTRFFWVHRPADDKFVGGQNNEYHTLLQLIEDRVSQISWITKDECMALYCYANGWNTELASTKTAEISGIRVPYFAAKFF